MVMMAGCVLCATCFNFSILFMMPFMLICSMMMFLSFYYFRFRDGMA